MLSSGRHHPTPASLTPTATRNPALGVPSAATSLRALEEGWVLHYLGRALPPVHQHQPTKQHRSALVQSIHEVPVESDGLEPLLSLLDQTMDFEFVLAGYRCPLGDPLEELEARVYSIHAVSDPPTADTMGNTTAGRHPTHRLRGLPWLVELSALCSDDQRVAVESRLWSAAKTLEPLLAFSSANPAAPKA
jgi:hypothetical protein